MGCLATHAAWHHPRTAHLTVDAGINWLHHVAGLNPATSHVIREWDRRGANDWEMRSELLTFMHEERRARGEVPSSSDRWLTGPGLIQGAGRREHLPLDSIGA